MVVGVSMVEIYIHDGHSLKSKRSVVNRIKQRVANRFNVSIAEVGEQELWQKATFGMSVTGNDRQRVNSVLDKIVNYIDSLHLAEIVNHEIEILDL